MSIFRLKSLIGWVFLQVRVKYETKISYHTALLVVGNIASAAVVSCLQGAPKVSCFPRDFAKNLIGY